MIDNTLRNVIRVMKFILPNNDIDKFSYECLAEQRKANIIVEFEGHHVAQHCIKLSFGIGLFVCNSN